jgi:hydroxymethylpyrimidine pyrophosphatase-like HAD family hydrolase
MVVSDLDGTLLTNDLTVTPRSGTPSPPSRRAASLSSSPPDAASWDWSVSYRALALDTPAICYNGAAVFDRTRDNKLFERPLPEAAARRAVALGRELGLLAQFYVDEELLVENRNADLDYTSPSPCSTRGRRISTN